MKYQDADNSISNSLRATLSIVLVAFNLRPAITGVGPLIGFLRDDLQLTNSQAGVLTTLPLLAFAGLSMAAPRLVKKWGIEWAIFAGLFTLLVGIFLRSGGYPTTLFVGTAIIGIGIAICNVLLPGLVKLKFEKHTGLMTGVYTTSMSLFATIGSGFSIPLAVQLGLEWQGAFAVWGVIAVVAMGVWTTQFRGTRNSKEEGKDEDRGPKLWQSPLAWYVTVRICRKTSSERRKRSLLIQSERLPAGLILPLCNYNLREINFVSRYSSIP
ncbi:MFS transporter [Salicibibacter kimchii]|uniref:MFS transporter n=1 Tax=Salicibibacter kimchii TaxID=2099786 RepID=A0A345C192_9BACI|nr:MFS transporter [Salicibibacter kimchii]AXF56973.1 MFS transporter [Salicibibacter kimchii]